jgi:hypothetical protein
LRKPRRRPDQQLDIELDDPRGKSLCKRHGIRPEM